MAHNRSVFSQASDRSESRRDGGFTYGWSFSLPGDGEAEPRRQAGVVSAEDMERQQPTSPEENKSPPLRHFGSSDPSRTYGNRSGSHMRSSNRSGPRSLGDAPSAVPTASCAATRTDFNSILSSALPPGIVSQGRHFQHAQVPSAIRKPVQRNNLSSGQPAVEVDSIVLTCPESPDEETSNIKRRVQQKRKPSENVGFSPQLKVTEPVPTSVYHAVCSKCQQPSQDSSRCQTCGSGDASVGPQAAPRPPIRTSPGPHGLQQNFYKAGAMREPSPVRVTGSRAAPSPPSNGRIPSSAGTSGCCRAAPPSKGRRTEAGQRAELNDPIVLSSDDEEDEAETGSTGSVNRSDNVSPRPADSAHSSPAPSGGRVEAAVKSAEESNVDFFDDVSTKITIPRRARMKDQFGNQPPAEQLAPRKKKPKVASSECESIISECRSVRIGTVRRMVTKPVIFSMDSIQVEAEGAEVSTTEKLCLQTSESISCEWCSVRKLPVSFFQTTVDECVRSRSQLGMSREQGGQWYDCSAEHVDEKYIVLIFENGSAMKEQAISEDISVAVGKSNGLSNFPAKSTFEEANIRSVNYNKASSQKVDKAKPEQPSPRASPSSAVGVSSRTRMATRQQGGAFFDEDEEEMTDSQPTFSGPVVKSMVYPPPPAKGGISVTNEDLHCLNDGEFLNDVIIDFYLKYLVLEKLKKEDAQRIHVFSSFFYKRSNQRDRRTGPDAASSPIQKRKHNRVKTWTRHVDLFQKDFIFVPINESAHWYSAVICFPGSEGPVLEKNPSYSEQPAEESIPEHCRPSSPDGSDCSPEQPEEADVDPGGSQDEREQHYSSESHRISVCYGSGNGDDAYAFSDDQSSCQDDCSDDGNPAEDAGAPDVSSLASKPVVCKQPCILIMDSSRGPGRSNVVKTSREYSEVEWEVRKASQRSFGKDAMKGSSPRVPQQDNFSDCGVYVSQYVESFFQNPIPSFHSPMNSSEWFPQQRMKTKREEIRESISKIKDQQEVDRRESDPAEAPPASPEEVEETAGCDP